MSPRADQLLPSDLLGDEEPSMATKVGSLSQGPHFPDPLADFTASMGLQNMQSIDSITRPPQTPGSPGSRPASIFHSPRESLRDLTETDRRSIHSNSISFSTPEAPDVKQSSSRKISSILGFGSRQRGKTLADEPPMLGTLKATQSHSFPRNLDQGLDPIGTRQRRGSHNGSWAQMSNFFPRASTGGKEEDAGTSASKPLNSFVGRGAFPNLFGSRKIDPLISGSRKGENSGYNPFSPKYDPLDPNILGNLRGDTSSPRPASTYSFENGLPRPSTESPPFGWPTEKNQVRGSPLGPDWSMAPGWSRSQSRRPSLQYGSTGHLPVGSHDSSDFLEAHEEHPRPKQAPIGTRPSSSRRPATPPRLNPTAPTFKTIFGMRSDKSKAKNQTDGPTDEDTDREESTANNNEESASPRLSRDSRSMASIPDSLDYPERTASNTPSGTPSEALGSSLASAKGGFMQNMQKLARKSSSGKFPIPWSGSKDKSAKSSISSNKKDPTSAPPADIDEDANGEAMARSLDSIAAPITPTTATMIGGEKSNPATPSGRSSLNLFSRRKKKGKGEGQEKEKEKGTEVASSVASTASEAGDDEDD